VREESGTIRDARKTFEEAQHFVNAGDYRRAIVRFEMVRQDLGPDMDSALWWNLGLCNWRLDRFATAAFCYERFLSSPGISEEDQRKADAILRALRRKMGAEAEDGFDLERARDRFYQAQEQYEAGQYRAAIILWERLRAQPGFAHPELLWNIARCNLKLERWATAGMYLDETWTDHPATTEEIEEVYDFGDRLYKRGMFRQALILFKVIERHVPMEEVAGEACAFRFNVAQCNRMLGRNAAATEDYQRVLEFPGIPAELRAEVQEHIRVLAAGA
jgi:tetratricopeptide (TPR) repeat protein